MKKRRRKVGVGGVYVLDFRSMFLKCIFTATSFVVIETCRENDIAVLAYSPLSSGILGDQIKSLDDLPGQYRN